MPSSRRDTLDRSTRRAAGLGAGTAAAAGPLPGRRRVLCRLALAWGALAQGVPAARAQQDVEALLRQGGVVIAFRHADAPGTFDPPGMRLDDCRTQRNLDDTGRAQARRIGQWFASRGLKPARGRSSPWCRCVDTASLAFGPPEVWPALGSPHGRPPADNERALAALRAAIVSASGEAGRFEAWVTHNFVLSALAGESTASGEGLVLRATPAGVVQVLGRLAI